MGVTAAKRDSTQYCRRTVAAGAGYDKLRAPTAYRAVLRLSAIAI
jgi:hypothetical protein